MSLPIGVASVAARTDPLFQEIVDISHEDDSQIGPAN